MYDFDSGDLSLDFANTKDWHGSEHPVENLNSFADLVAWGEQAGLITHGGADKLLRKVHDQPQDASRSYNAALRLREAIYHIFSSLYASQPLPADDFSYLNAELRKAMANLQLAPKGSEVRWEWVPGIDGMDLILGSVARAAADLLTSERLSRVRECEDDRGCGYLFIDQTKNHSRRWCSMDSCGNRAKARRHYARQQAN